MHVYVGAHQCRCKDLIMLRQPRISVWEGVNIRVCVWVRCISGGSISCVRLGEYIAVCMVCVFVCVCVRILVCGVCVYPGVCGHP